MSDRPRYPKRLIEVDLPIKRISAHARREKSIRHGHISTLHIWWARRPLAACRAVICAALWPDPADELCPESFRREARKQMETWSRDHLSLLSQESYPHFVQIQQRPKALQDNVLLRQLLLDFIADFANWDNSTVKEYLETSRSLTQAAHEGLGGTPGTRPLVVDPFAGGGSIPLEALRVGADAFASDLNPVAVLLNKVVLEYIPKYGQILADALRKYGKSIKAEAASELGELYPKDPAGGTPVAYLWARTILSEAPSSGGTAIQIPLLRSMWLSKRKGFMRAMRWARNDRGEVRTEKVTPRKSDGTIEVRRPILELFTPTQIDQVEAGSVRGGAATCPVTGFTTAASRVKEQLKAQRGGADNSFLFAVYVEQPAGREFRLSEKRDQEIYQNAAARSMQMEGQNPSSFPTEAINPIRPYKNTRGLSAVTRIGCLRFCDIYNRRQALSIQMFYDLVKRHCSSLQESNKDLFVALRTLLALAVNRAVSQNTSMSRWDASRLTIKGAFSKQALAVVWDFSEANPFSGASADWDGAIEWIVKFIEANTTICGTGTAMLSSATSIPLPSDSAAALITDPPYFAAIPYADLSDFFYVWLKRGLADIHPQLFGPELTEKVEELIVTNAEKGRNGRTKNDSFFREGMTAALDSAREAVNPSGVGVVVYAEGTTAGWEAILEAIIRSNWIVSSSWPIDTEMETRTQAQGSASLQSSIHIVCRPRESPDGSVRTDEVGDWRDVLTELPGRIHEWMPRLAEEGVVGADAIFACLGPALEIFSRYSRVEKASGEAVTLKEYLEQVWAAVAKEALTMIFSGADASGFEEDARLTAMWLWTLKTGDTNGVQTVVAEEDSGEDEEGGGKKAGSGFVLEFDAARKIAQGLGAHLEDLQSLVEVAGETARLLPVAERARHLFGAHEGKAATVRKRRRPQMDLFDAGQQVAEAESSFGETKIEHVGATVLDRIHQSMILFAAGRGEALKRFLIEDGTGQDQRFWRLAQALSALYPSHTEEKRWVDGVLARKKGLGF